MAEFLLGSLTSRLVQGLSVENQLQLLESLKQAQKHLEQSRQLAEEHIDIAPPWDYDPNNHSINQKAIYISLKWSIEGCDSLKETSNPDLEVLANRIEEGSKSLCDEIDSEDTENPYKGLYLLMSSLDGLIVWLCEHDDDIDPRFRNKGNKPIYFGDEKQEAIETWYDEHALFGVKEDDGQSFRETWEQFWNHRHRIMHGSPDAYYDENIGVATLFFIGLTEQIVKRRYEELNSENNGENITIHVE